MSKWCTNGSIDKKYEYELPEGFWPGRTKCGPGTKDTRWITNGKVQKLISKNASLPEGFRLGKLPHSQIHKEHLSKALKGRVFTNEWCKNISNGHRTESYKKKIETTCLQKFGVKNPFNQPYVIAKVHSEEMKKLMNETKRKNNSFCSSKSEDALYEFLLTIFDNNNIERQYDNDDRYPFACDFYIKSLDLFIECNFHWTHGNHLFNKNNSEDVATLALWKSKDSKYYKNAIYVWTVLDVKKFSYLNNLNYLVLWNQTSAIDDFMEYLQCLYK